LAPRLGKGGELLRRRDAGDGFPDLRHQGFQALLVGAQLLQLTTARGDFSLQLFQQRLTPDGFGTQLLLLSRQLLPRVIELRGSGFQCAGGGVQVVQGLAILADAGKPRLVEVGVVAQHAGAQGRVFLHEQKLQIALAAAGMGGAQCAPDHVFLAGESAFEEVLAGLQLLQLPGQLVHLCLVVGDGDFVG